MFALTRTLAVTLAAAASLAVLSGCGSTAGLLTALAFADVLEVWHLIVLSLVSGSFRAFQMTSTQSLMPNLVQREHWLNAIALNQLTIQGSRLVGPALIAPALLLFHVLSH